MLRGPPSSSNPGVDKILACLYPEASALDTMAIHHFWLVDITFVTQQNCVHPLSSETVCGIGKSFPEQLDPRWTTAFNSLHHCDEVYSKWSAAFGGSCRFQERLGKSQGVSSNVAFVRQNVAEIES
ncbi:hypothetical protein MTO96_037577 [Rhipicephalus appendiculatus]